jgi:hypothetical protein
LNHNFISRFERVPIHTRREHRLWRRQFANPMDNVSSVILHVEVDKAVRVPPFYRCNGPLHGTQFIVARATVMRRNDTAKHGESHNHG